MKPWRCAAITAIGTVVVSCSSDETGTLELFPPGEGALPSVSTTASAPAPTPTVPAGGCRSDSDCGSDGTAPLCLVETGACVECVTDADCSDGDRLLCEPVLQLCVECLSDGDCLDPSKPGCLIAEGRCEPCSTDLHCPLGQQCDTSEGQCR